MRGGDQEAMSGPRAGWGAISRLRQVALRQGNLLARLHAIWGLGQLGRFRAAGNDIDPWATLDPLIEDGEAEVRAQVAKVLGDLREPRAFDVLIDHLEDQPHIMKAKMRAKEDPFKDAQFWRLTIREISGKQGE